MARGGDAPGRVREGGQLSRSVRDMGERYKLPHRGLRRSLRSQRFCVENPSKDTQKQSHRSRAQPICVKSADKSPIMLTFQTYVSIYQ